MCLSEASEVFSTACDRVRGRFEERWTILRCRTCGFGWTDPPLKEEEIAACYPAGYLGDTLKIMSEFRLGNLQRTRSWRRETEKVRLVERFTTGGSLLDVGCGDGKFLMALDGQRWKKTGVEFNREVVQLVNSTFPDLQLIRGDLFSEELQESSFDVITFWHVFEHLPGSRRVLERARRLLRPEGWIFISLPNLESWQARLFRHNWYAFDDVPRHLYHFSPNSLELLLQEVGLRLITHRFFSRMVNMHCLKHSLIHWSEEQFASRIPYYFLKPLLLGFPLIERMTGRYGMLTSIGQKPYR